MDNLKHYSVLLHESIDLLNIIKDGNYLDCTVGGAGHSAEILKRIPDGHLYGFDQDNFAINRATERLNQIGNNFTLYKDNFVNIKHYFSDCFFDGIIYDLGVSSFQFDLPERGFSYRFDGPLDMRMNEDDHITAADIVNNYEYNDLVRIFYEYGEEKYAKEIARKIVAFRSVSPITSTLQLVDIIKSALPAKELRKSGHPAKQVFQALRIEVNDELHNLEKSLVDALSLLKPNGILVVITFHSLEDRIVKRLFKKVTTFDLPKGIPFVPENMKLEYELVNTKVILPSKEELNENNRSHSAKLRSIKRLSIF